VFPTEWRTVVRIRSALQAAHRLPHLASGAVIVRGCSETLIDKATVIRSGGRQRRLNTMTPLDVVLAEITALEAARDALPSNSHTGALFSLTLYRLQEEADALRLVALKMTA
jgi:hypothetical protein